MTDHLCYTCEHAIIDPGAEGNFTRCRIDPEHRPTVGEQAMTDESVIECAKWEEKEDVPDN